jgi:hypothetical protein
MIREKTETNVENTAVAYFKALRRYGLVVKVSGC